MRQKVTIEDIARETELSRGTVSRAINDRPDISVATKQRVLQACRKLNYAPSHAARCLATGRSYAIIAFLRDLCDPHAAAILSGATRRAEEAGYLMHPLELSESDEAATATIDRFVNERIDGALVTCAVAATVQRALADALGDKPCVHTHDAGARGDSVAPDWREAGRAAARFSATHGLKRVLLVDSGARTAAREGFLEAALTRHVQVTTLAAPAGSDEISTIGERLETIDGIVTIGDLTARTVAAAAAAAGYRPGERVAVLSIGDGPWATQIHPTISAVDVDPVEIGRRAVERMLARLNGAPDHARSAELVAPRVVERESTAGGGSGRARPGPQSTANS